MILKNRKIKKHSLHDEDEDCSEKKTYEKDTLEETTTTIYHKPFVQKVQRYLHKTL